MIPLLIVQPGRKLPALTEKPGDFSDWILAGMGMSADGVPVCRPQQGEPLPPPEQVGAVVITGSSAMVTERAPWMLATEAWLRQVVTLQRPLLGICFGHQLLAQALGGEVADNPRGIEVGTVTTRLTGVAAKDPLFAGLPGELRVQASHRQSVRRLPDDAVLLAASDQDPHHAFRYGPRAWGVQFHPEFDAEVVAAYEAYYGPRLDPAYGQRAARQRTETPRGAGLLKTFHDSFS